jgi:predicted AAA+ superfamily ATPase
METVTFSSNSKAKIEQLKKLAREIGISPVKKAKKYVQPVDEISIVSEPSLAEAWSSKEDERWDELYKK